MFRILIAAATFGLASAQNSKSSIKADQGNLVFSSPDGDVTFKGANTFSIQSDDGSEYDLNERLATIETDSAAQLKTLQDELEAFRNKTEVERALKFQEFDEKIEANEKVLANMKKACPLGSVVTNVGADGSLQCTDYKVQQEITEGCAAGEAFVSVNDDGTAKCAKVQAPVQSCPAGSGIQSVNAETGAVTCEKDGQDKDFASFFTVWGRQTCAGNSDLVYAGAMAGGLRYRNGGSATYLCLPSTKPYATEGFHGSNQEGVGINIIELRSATDLSGGNQRWSHNNDLNFDDMSCAVCKVNSPNTVVVAGHTTCPVGYSLNYRGWLAAEHYNSAKITTRVCLFNTPQGHIGQSEGNNNRGWLYLTEMERTALPPNGIANGYKYDYEIACAHCSSDSETEVGSYVRWGANSCPDKSKMLYDGFMANGRFSESGGGADYQCMARGPEYTGAEGRNSAGSSRIYSAEYMTSALPAGGTYKKVHLHDAACAVCETETSNVLNMYGSQKCPAGYELQYKGMLFSTRIGDPHLGENICVDDAPVGVVGQRAGVSNGARLYPVEVMKPPGSGLMGYKEGTEVGCAVCRATPERHVTTYVEWGRKACSTGAKTLYSSWMANANPWHKGGGFNYMCMSPQGDLEAKQINKAKNHDKSGLIHRTEYAQSTKNSNGAAWGRMKAKNARDAACSVCEIEAEDTLMLPAKTACPTGYKKLYEGYVAGGNDFHQHDTEYICLHKEFEEIDPAVFKGASDANQNGARLFLNEVDSAFYGLQYKANLGIQCVMCMKQ